MSEENKHPLTLEGNGTVAGLNGRLEVGTKEGAEIIISSLIEHFSLSPTDLGFRY